MCDTDLESLRKVEEVNNLVRKLAECEKDDTIVFDEVNEFLKKTETSSKGKSAFDRTVINKSTKSNDEYMRDAFMRDIERDARERNDRKIQAKDKADKIKQKANEYFKAYDFDKAIELYSNAINVCKDYEILYTNRAQAYLKVSRLAEAFEDCETALFFSPNNHKALLHKGKSLVRLNRFDEAVECYRRAVEIAPNLTKFLQEFIYEAEKLKRMAEIRNSSELEFDRINDLKSRNRTIEQILIKLSSKATNSTSTVEYCFGGLQILLQLVDGHVDEIEKLKQIAKENKYIFDKTNEVQKVLRTIITKKPQKVTETEWYFLNQWLQLFKTMMTKTDDEQFLIFVLSDSNICFPFVEYCCKHSEYVPPLVVCSLISLMHYLSFADVAVQQMFDKLPVSQIVNFILKSIKNDHEQSVLMVGVTVFNNLLQSQRFKVSLAKDDGLISSVIECLYSFFVSSLTCHHHELSMIINIIEALADNSTIRVRLVRHDKFIDECINAIESRLTLHSDDKQCEILFKLFRFIHNLMVLTKNSPSNDKLKSFGQRILSSASSLLSYNPKTELRDVLLHVLTKTLLVLNEEQLETWCTIQQPINDTVNTDSSGISLCRSLSRQNSLTDNSYLNKVCVPLKICITILDVPNHPLLHQAVQILTLASKVSQAVRFLCCDVRERTLKLQSLLYKEKQPIDEMLVGNICLLFINCVNDTPLAEHLSNTPVIKDLLRICGDANKVDCRRNAAILIGKLAQSSHVHRSEISKLNGFSIISKFHAWSS